MPQQAIPQVKDPDEWLAEKKSQLDPDVWLAEQDATAKAEAAAKQAGSIPSRIMSGAARGLTETVEGLGGLISGGYEALKGLPETLKGAFTLPTPTPEQEAEFRKEQARYEGTRTGEFFKPEHIPILGPIGKAYGEAAGKDPAEAAGRIGFDALTLLLGGGTKAAGRKIGESTARAEAEALAGGIKGAPATALEARTGILPGAARAVAASPLGESRVASLAAERQPAIETAIGKLTAQGAPVEPVVRAETLFGEAPTQVGAGQAVKAGIKKHKGAIRGIESRQWTGLESEIESRGIKAGLDNTIEAAEPLYRTSKEAFDLMASQLSPEARNVLQKIASKDPTLIQGGKTMNIPNILAQAPAAESEAFAKILGQDTGASWGAVKDIRSKIGEMIESRLKSHPIGDPETRALTILRDALTKDMRSALEGNPGLLKQFDVASGTTKFKHKTFGKGMPGGIIRKEPKVQPSQIIEKASTGTPEQARSLRAAIGSQKEAVTALKGGTLQNLLERHTKKGGTDYFSALNELTTNPNYKRLLGNEGYNTARESLIAQGKQQAQTSLGELFQKSTNGKLGEQDAIFDGPGFAARWRGARPKFEKMGLEPDHLKAIDEFAHEAGKLGLSKQASLRKGAASPGYGSYLTLTGLLGVLGSLAMGSAKPLLGVGAMAAGEVALMRYMMQPQGVRLISRALKLQKAGKPLGEVADALAKIAVMAPKETKNESQPVRPQ